MHVTVALTFFLPPFDFDRVIVNSLTIAASSAIARQAGIPVSFDVNLRPLEAHLPTTLRDRTMRAVGLADFILGSAADEFTLLADDSDPIRAAQRMAAEGRVAIARSNWRPEVASSGG